MFLSHLLMLIVGIFLSVGTNILTQSDPQVTSALSFIASGLFLSFSAYIFSKVHIEAEKAGGSFTSNLKNAWKLKISKRIGLQRKTCVIIYIIISILFVAFAIVTL